MNSSSAADICVAQQVSITIGTDFNSKNLPALIPLIYGFPSIILSILIIKLLLSKPGRKDFNSTFYSIFSIVGIIEISEWIMFNIVQRLTSAPLLSIFFTWIPKDGIIVSIIYFLVSYTGYLSHIPSLLLTTNRLTSVLLPLSHEHHWRKLLKPVLIIYFLYPLIFSWQFLFMNQIRHCQIWDLNFTKSYHVFATQLPYYGIPLYIGVTAIAFLVCSSCLIMNLTTTIVLIYRRKHRTTTNSNERKIAHTEFKMFIITLMMFFNEFTLGMMMLISSFVPPTSAIRTNILAIEPFVVDLLCLSPPWMLIIMSKKIRSQIFVRIFKNNNSTVVQPLR